MIKQMNKIVIKFIQSMFRNINYKSLMNFDLKFILIDIRFLNKKINKKGLNYCSFEQTFVKQKKIT